MSRGEFSTKEKNQIVELCFRVYARPAEGSSFLCSDFYSICYAASPQVMWLHISWIGRALHAISRKVKVGTLPTNQPLHGSITPGKGKNQTIFHGYTLLDPVQDSPNTKELQTLCKTHNTPFVETITHINIQKVKETIDLFYKQPKNASVDFLDLLRAALDCNSYGDKQEATLKCIATWKGSPFILVPIGKPCPEFVVLEDFEGKMNIQINTFQLSYQMDFQGEVLSLSFSKLLHSSQVILHHSPIPVPDNMEMCISLSEMLFDLNSVEINTSNSSTLNITSKQRM